MSRFPAAKAKRVLAALLRIRWQIKRQAGSHRARARPDHPDLVLAFHDAEETSPAMLSRIARHSGRKPEDL